MPGLGGINATAFILTHRSDADPTRYSASFQALALTRSLGRRGVPVVRLHAGRRELSLTSRYCWRSEDCPNVHESEEALLEFLLALAPKYSGTRVLLPASDDTAYFLGRHREALGAAYRVVAPSGATVETIIDKRCQYAAAQAAGIPIPETYFPRDLADVEELACKLKGYPYIIKPNVAHRWRLSSVKRHLRSTQGTPNKAVLVPDAKALVAEYQQIARTDADVMIQTVIGGPDEQLFGFFGYFDAKARARGYCVRKKFRQHPLRFGYCTLIESCENETVVRQSLQLLESLGYHGIVGVEWKLDPQSGKYLLVEINARATNTSSLPPACGVDLPYIAFADAIGDPVPVVTQWKSGVKWLWFAGDFWAARSLMRRGELGAREWLRSLRGTRAYAVHAPDDLRPFFVELAVLLKIQLAMPLRGLARCAARILSLPARALANR